MASPDFPNTQMVVGVNHKLGNWWKYLKKNRELEVRQLLGGLTFLIFVEPDRYLIKALLKFWDPASLVFKFKDYELTPTIEEVVGLLDLPYQNCQMIVPHKQSLRSFLKDLGMRYNPNLDCLNEGWTTINFLYSHFGDNEGYKNFKRKFACSAKKWKRYCLNAFTIALLGFVVFPRERGKINTTLSSVVRALARGMINPTKIVVPMILAEMIRGLSACVKGRRFFEGCNFLLQLWAIEHFHQRSNLVDIFNRLGNKIASHPKRMSLFRAPVEAEDWFIYLKELSGHRIQWKYYWLKTPRAIVRGDKLYFIELIGLKGIQPYAPLRVLRQFGQVQMISLRSNIGDYEYDSELNILQVHNIQRRWERVITIDMREERAFCTPEYCVWILENAESRDLSEEGHPGLGDEREREWAHNLLNQDYDITPEIREQLMPNYGDQHI